MPGESTAARLRGKFDRLVVVATPGFPDQFCWALFSAGVEPDREIGKEMIGSAAIQELIDAHLVVDNFQVHVIAVVKNTIHH